MKPACFTIAVLSAGLAASGGAAAATPPEVPAKVFLTACMVAKGNAEASKSAVQQLGFVAATAEQKARVMRKGGTGDAYIARDIVVVVERGSPICTVLGNSEKPQATGVELAKLLPPSLPFSVKTEKAGDTQDQSSVLHRISLNGKPFATWTFSHYKRPAVFNVAITLQMSGAGGAAP